MQFVSWLMAAAIVYLAIGKVLFVAIDGVTRRDWGRIVLLATVCVGAFILAPVFPRAATPHGIPAGTTRFYVYELMAFACMALLGSWGISAHGQKKLTWQDKKRRAELSRQIKLHLALVTGAIAFSVPFYWLVTTSLKPDERTNMFPPDLVPMMQRSVKIGGEEKKVYLTTFDDKEVGVVKVAELEGDNWEVRFPDHSGVTRIIPASRIRPDLYPIALWRNYRDALEFLPPEYRRGLVPLWNTMYVTGLVILGTVLSSSLVAFAFARLRWPGRDLLFVIMLATMMIPGAVTMLPVFLIYRSLGWIDTLRPLWVGAFFGSGFNIFLLRQFFLTIPNDLEDAAKIDGCSYFRIYWNIMLPLIKPALAALTIFAFMGSWNDFMGPLIYLSSPEKMTLAYALQLFQGAHGGEPAMMMAAATLVMLPVLAVFFFTQRYMIQGVTLTGIKA